MVHMALHELDPDSSMPSPLAKLSWVPVALRSGQFCPFRPAFHLLSFLPITHLSQTPEVRFSHNWFLIIWISAPQRGLFRPTQKYLPLSHPQSLPYYPIYILHRTHHNLEWHAYIHIHTHIHTHAYIDMHVYIYNIHKLFIICIAPLEKLLEDRKLNEVVRTKQGKT